MNRLKFVLQCKKFYEKRCAKLWAEMSEAKEKGEMWYYRRQERFYIDCGDKYYKFSGEAYDLCWGFVKTVQEAGATPVL